MISCKQYPKDESSKRSAPASQGFFKKHLNYVFNFLKNPLATKLVVSLVVILFVAIFLTNNYLYIKNDIGLKANDNHFYRSIQYYDKLVMKGDVSLTNIRFPPLVYLVTTCFYVVNGVSLETARLSILFFGIIFLLAMFGIGYELGGNFGGISVMALAAASPHVLDYSRSYFLDFPQTALTALALYLLLKTDFFRDRKYSMLFGVVTAFAMLTKWSTAFFLIIPVLWFLIPNIFRSFKSFKAFLIYLVPASIMLTGTVWYLKQIDSTAVPLFHQWMKYYLYFAVVPAIVCIVTMLLLDLRWKKEDDYNSSGRQAIVNFSFMSSVFAIIASVWFYWAGFSVRSMIPTYAFNDPRSISMNIPIMQTFLMTMMNFAPFLLILGIIFLIIKKKNTLRDLVIPVSLILTSLLMIRLMYDLFRVIIPLIIFGAALGGYWVGIIKNRKISMTLTILLVLISLTSITVSGQNLEKYSCFQYVRYNLDFYKPWKLLVSAPPEVNDFNFHPVLEHVTYHGGDGWKDIAVYTSDDFPGDVNNIFVDAYSLGKKFTAKYSWQSNRPRLFQEHAARAHNGERQDFEMMDDILIIHKWNENPGKVSDQIVKTFFTGMPIQTKTYQLNKNWRITNIKIDRHQIWANKKNPGIPAPAKM